MSRKEDIEIKRTFSEQLPCSLSEAELANIARKIGQKRREVEEYKAKKRQVTDHYTDLIAGSEAQADQLAEAADKGVEMRAVVCAEAFLWPTGTVEVRRSDTQEVVRTRPMTAEERQAGMPWAPPTDKPAKEPKEKKGRRSKPTGVPLLQAAEHDRKDDSTEITSPAEIIDAMPPEEPKAKTKKGKAGKKGGKKR